MLVQNRSLICISLNLLGKGHVYVEFFISVIHVSKQRIYYFFKTKFNRATGVALSPTKCNHVKLCVDAQAIEGVRKHI